MKTIYIIIRKSIGLFLFAAFVGCDDFVQVALPDSQLASSAVFEDKGTATAALTSVYAKIRDYSILSGAPNGVSHSLGLYADEFTYYGVGSSPTDLYHNELVSTDPELKELWSTSYNQIYAVNAIIKGVSQSTSLAASDRDVLTGEALFVRALLHFYLVNLYGDVPYISTTDYAVNSKVKRMSVDAVYTHIKKDLNEAVLLLPEAYLKADRTRPNVYVAHALLARVNLYMGLWAEAANEASAVLNQTDLYAMAPLSTTFKKTSTGTLWQLSPESATYNTLEGNTFIFTAGPPPRSALSPALLQSFEANDMRKSSWIKTISSGTSSWSHPNKYKNKQMQGTPDEFSILFRMEEQYLIRAEARARQGELINAKEDLNIIRNHAGLENTTAVTGEEIITAVLNERRHELFTELGHRFFDLKRTGELTAVLSTLKTGWNATDALFPLPNTELLLNANLLPQNPGY